jgi:3-methylfumaryl-CoA hydratase
MSHDFSDWIGRSIAREDIVTPRLIAEYRATMSPHLFEPADQSQCPPGLHWGLAPATPGYDECAPDGSEARGSFLPPIPLPRRMWAGGSIETLRPIRVGQQVCRISTIADIKKRDGKTGALFVLSIKHDFMAAGELLVRERQDLVFRDAASKLVPPSETSAAIAADWTIAATPLRLFRFSAFTFNGHRIHYDAPYAAVEGYPGLVVHGPMQAALMLNLTAAQMGRVPERFDYRCVAPLFGGGSFGVKFDAASSTARIVRHDGVTTAEGQALAPGT